MGHTHRGAIGLAELLRALDDYDGDPPAHLVELLGYAPVERPPARKAPPPAKGKTGSEQRGAGLDTDPPPTSPDAEPEPHAPSTFWRATAYKPEQQAQHRERRIAATGSPPRRARWVIPPTRLAAFESLINPLRLALRQARLGTQADIPEAVRRISEGEWLAELPREMRAGWGTSLTVVEDRSPHLAPYRRDQGHVHDRLRRVFNPETFHAFLYLPPAELPQRPRSQSAAPPFDPRDGQQVLILGDLGVLIRDPVQRAHAQSRWRRLLSRLRSQGVHPVVLLPFDARDLPPDLAGNVVALSWRPGTEALPSPQWAAAQIERLLRHMAWIGRVEPPLLRALRVELGLPMAVESWAWQDPRVDASPGISASVRAEYAAGLRAQAELDHAHRDACLERVREHAGAYGYSLWLETVLNTLHLSATPARGDDIDHALRLLEHIAGRLEAEDVHAFVEPQWAWLRDFEQRWSRRLRDSERTREACRAIQAVVARQRIVDPKSIDEDEPPPTGAWQLVLHASRLRAFPAGSPPVSGSFVCEMSSTDALISIQAGEVEQASRTRDPDFWADGLAPDWASDWGHDGFDSPWCEFQIGAVTQRLRWCPPGEFLMGSPEHEPGRFDDEGPRHRVTLAEGYWIMDTPVTQALWLAVMWGDNPSQFQSPDRPVEQVSWEDAQGFVRRLEQRLPGLGLKLPSEAQWEYACRADARDEAYAGEIQLRGEAEAPGLEPVAWYGGNSEQGFELENG
ncbi:MAG: SUMF1/EgtB/PvdO family nonheme iron enzyme, partial [Gammaproteobacteria bacterium]